MSHRTLLITASAALAAAGLSACGAGVPITVRIDEVAFEVNLDEAMAGVESTLLAQGTLPPAISGIPERWPDELPPLRYTAAVGAPPSRVDMTPDDPNSKEGKKYKDINKYADAVRRIEINRMVLRYERNSANMAFPGFEIQAADDPNADPDDRFAWYTLGRVPPAEAGFVGDLEFEWAPGGESFLNAQMADDEREFALRTVGTVEVDTEANPARPRGVAGVRLIVVATFFIEPDTLFGTLKGGGGSSNGDDSGAGDDVGGDGDDVGGGDDAGDGDGTGDGDDAGDGDDIVVPPDGFCDGPEGIYYDPDLGFLDTLPDDFFTVTDAAAPTGLRVDIPSSIGGGSLYRSALADISTQDGFGATAGMFLTFSSAIDPASLPVPGAGSGSAAASLVLVNLDSASPELTDLDWHTSSDGSVLFVWPRLPLAPETRYALAVTTRVHDAMGRCFAPSMPMERLLSGAATGSYARLQAAVSSAVSKLSTLGTIADARDLTAVVTFTTQSSQDQASSIASSIRGLGSVTYTPPGSCTSPADKPYLVCEGTLAARDYRGADGVIDASDVSSPAAQNLTVTAYIPKVGSKPYPTVIYGHGLGGSRGQAAELAEVLAAQETSGQAVYAVIALDAPTHGDYPGASSDPADWKPDFFGLDMQAFSVEPLRMRDNLHQAAFDKLHLLRSIIGSGNVDDVAGRDLDHTKLIYVGVSLGGIMGAEFLGFAPEVTIGGLVMPGARLVNTLREGSFSELQSFPLAQDEIEEEKLWVVMQTAFDSGDPGTWVKHVLRERLAGFDAATPQVLMQMSVPDLVVPNSSNLLYARGMGLPLVGTMFAPYDVESPVPGNGLVQFAQICATDCSDGQKVSATHATLPRNVVSHAHLRLFLDTALTGSGTIEANPFSLVP